MTRTRLVTGLVYVPLIAVAIQLGGWLYFLAVLLATLLALWEFDHMFRVRGHAPYRWLLLLFGGLLLLDLQLQIEDGLQSVITLLLVSSLIFSLFQAQHKSPVIDWAITVAGVLYLALGMGHLLLLRSLPGGEVWVWLVILGAWGNDTLAYFSGRQFGKHKLWPRLSPKKTWEGFFGGLLGSLIGGLLVFAVADISLGHILAMALLISVIGPLGDLSVSMMKRYTGVKDASNLLPGHGGLLDRIDSLIFATIGIYYYVVWLVV